MTVVAVLDGCIQAAVGPGGKGGLSTLPYDPGQGLESALAALREKGGLPKGKISFLLPSDMVTGRILTLPALPARATAEAVAHELEGWPITDYLPLSGKGPRRRYLAAGCREETLTELEGICSRLGVKIGRVSTVVESLLKILRVTKAVRGESFLWLVGQGGTVTSLLVEEGKCQWFGHSPFPPSGGEGAIAALAEDVARFRGEAPKVYHTGMGLPGTFPLPIDEEYLYVLGSFLRLGREEP